MLRLFYKKGVVMKNSEGIVKDRKGIEAKKQDNQFPHWLLSEFDTHPRLGKDGEIIYILIQKGVFMHACSDR